MALDGNSRGYIELAVYLCARLYESHEAPSSTFGFTVPNQRNTVLMKVAHKPLDAMEKGNELGAAEPNKKCSLYIIHSKFFNITKDPFCATIFKSMQVSAPVGFFLRR